MSDSQGTTAPQPVFSESVLGREIALVESRTFWCAVLGLVAVLAQAFGWQSALAFALDPASADKVLQGITLLAGFGAVLFTRLSRGPVTSVLPKGGAPALGKVAAGFLAFALLGVIGSGLSACNAVNSINQVTGALSSPAANQAAQNVKIGARALVCSVGSVADLANRIAVQTGAGHALIKDSANVYVIGQAICDALGGTVSGSEPVATTAKASVSGP